MSKGSSEKVREVAGRIYIRPARNRRELVDIRVGDMQNLLRTEDFPSAHINQICTSLESDKFWRPLGLQMLTPKGQPRRVDTVFRFAFIDHPKNLVRDGVVSDPLMELSGILRGAIREGASAFLRELRRDKEPQQANSGEESAA
jgi:hypothetical protein